ncbi:MAG: hypothetical protein HOD60_08315 [Candidatus Nitrosopelagicus sp.]|jgi:type I restriction enzyme, S subunit|nr:hypothetical protein [Candidatus Nitrosopelagicus sp.]
MSQQELELPKGWVETKLNDIAIRLQAGGTPSTKQSAYYENGKIPFVKIDDITDTNTKYLETTKIKITKEGLNNSSAWLVPENSILYSMYASYGLPIINKIKVATNQAIIVYEPPKELISLDFIYYFLKFMGPFSTTKGTTQKNLNAGIVKNYQVLLPPLNEQKRIVSKINQLFSYINSIEQSMKYTKQQLGGYRYSYNNWIFHGDFKEKFGFSSNWEEKPLGKMFKIIGGGTPDTTKPEYWNGDVPWVTSADIHGIKNILPRRTVTKLGIDNSATHKIPTNSILVVTRVGLGKLAITNSPVCINQDVQAILIDSKAVLPLYVLNYLSQTIQIFRFRNQGTTISGVTKKQLFDIPFFLPSIDEQKKIIEHMELVETKITNSQNIVNSTLQNIKNLKISIFKKAFEGKLVSQDPNDEPASVLLEKIKSTKESQLTKKRITKNVK